jgi:hypothetical protein
VYEAQSGLGLPRRMKDTLPTLYIKGIFNERN